MESNEMNGKEEVTLLCKAAPVINWKQKLYGTFMLTHVLQVAPVMSTISSMARTSVQVLHGLKRHKHEPLLARIRGYFSFFFPPLLTLSRNLGVGVILRAVTFNLIKELFA